MVDTFSSYLPVIPFDIMMYLFVYIFIGIGFTLSFSVFSIHFSNKKLLESFKIDIDNLDEKEIAILILRPIISIFLWLPYSLYLIFVRNKEWYLKEV